MQNLVSGGHINFLLVFAEGLFSFFSPCVLPLLPVYMSCLAGSARRTEEGAIAYSRGRTMLHTLCFILGVSCAFFLLGLSFTALGSFLSGHRSLVTRVGGILIVLLGLFQLGFFDLKFLQRERKFHLNLAGRPMNPLLALVMGFSFSFAWTPCVGPALSSVLILASGAKTAATGYLLVLVYAAGFLIPFLVLGLFTSQALAFLKRNQKWMRYTVKAGGVLLILMGVMTFTGWMNGISSYLSTASLPQAAASQEAAPAESAAASSQPAEQAPAASQPEESAPQAPAAVPAPDFTLTDQYGNSHTLSDYQGQVVFLNFWATWCPPCQGEMPHIEELYQQYGLNEGEVVILGVANPKDGDHPYSQDVTQPEVEAFLQENGYTFPVVMDVSGEVFAAYGIRAFPTTFMIAADGSVYGYVPGAMSKAVMEDIIRQTQQAGEGA